MNKEKLGDRRMDIKELVTEVLEILRDMDDAVDVICDLDAEAVMERMEIEKTIVKAVPIDELIKLRDKIQKLHDDTDTKAKAEESYRGFNEKADLACFLYRNDFIKPLNDLIEQYGFKEKEEEMESEE